MSPDVTCMTDKLQQYVVNVVNLTFALIFFFRIFVAYGVPSAFTKCEV